MDFPLDFQKVKLTVLIEIFKFRSARRVPVVPHVRSDDPEGVELRFSILSIYARGLPLGCQETQKLRA